MIKITGFSVTIAAVSVTGGAYVNATGNILAGFFDVKSFFYLLKIDDYLKRFTL